MDGINGIHSLTQVTNVPRFYSLKAKGLEPTNKPNAAEMDHSNLTVFRNLL